MTKTIDQGKTKLRRCASTSLLTDRRSCPGVNEAHIRQSLIDPLFEALGWDVRNKAMTAPQYREVIPKTAWTWKGTRRPRITPSASAPCASFMPKPKVRRHISADPGPAFQLRRYGFSGNLRCPFSPTLRNSEFTIAPCDRTERQGEPCPNPVLSLR